MTARDDVGDRRDCGGVRILDFAVGDIVVAKDPTRARCKVLAVRKSAGDHHDAILVARSGERIWQDGYWFRIVKPAKRRKARR